MKFAVALLVIAVCLFASVQGYRQRRSMAFEPCPKDVDCEAYAKEKTKGSICSSYGTDGKSITYLGCGNAYCGINTRKVQDLSKPYPYCCEDCEVIEEGKETEFAITI